MKNITPKLHNPKNKFFLYARKSTEWDERQIQSLNDQIKVMKQTAKNYWVVIIDTVQESQSAKEPGRPKFNTMVQRIKNGEAEWVIAWKIDRLTRNPIDTGTIQYMLQMGEMNRIITNDREYLIEDAWLLFSVETGMANQFILDLKKNVRRWMDSKTEKWIFCGQAPEGYINNKWEKTIEEDPDNFKLVLKIFKLILTGTYTVPQLVRHANKCWWYKSKKNKSWKLTESWLYGMLKNPFYTGDFLWKWEIKKGTHKAMISWAEYERVQMQLWNKWSAIRGRTREFSYSWMIRCWECWWSFVWVEKDKYVKATNTIKSYHYYKCSKRKKWCTCSQKPITLSKLEEQIDKVLKSIEIRPEFKRWWIEMLQGEFKEVRTEKECILANVNSQIISLQNQLDKLLDYLMSETITQEQYHFKKSKIEQELRIAEQQRQKLLEDHDDSIEKIEDLFDFISCLRERFELGALKDKRLIFSHLGENFTLRDWTLAMELNPWLLPLIKYLPKIKREYRRLELQKNGSSKWILEPNSSLISLWSGGPGLNWHTQGLKP